MEILLFAIVVKCPEHVSMISLHVLKYSRKFSTNHINLASFHFTYGSKKKVDFSLPLSKLCTLRQLKNKSVISPYLTVAVLSDVLNIDNRITCNEKEVAKVAKPADMEPKCFNKHNADRAAPK